MLHALHAIRRFEKAWQPISRHARRVSCAGAAALAAGAYSYEAGLCQEECTLADHVRYYNIVIGVECNVTLLHQIS